ncbi:hypothetical protein FB446DRAFT_746100 [Lentinula raphanica]|nr:hypothetical protein FB446DRAFT_746100 [Lentinula raphanica]
MSMSMFIVLRVYVFHLRYKIPSNLFILPLAAHISIIVGNGEVNSCLQTGLVVIRPTVQSAPSGQLWYDAAKEYPNDREAQEARFVAWYYGSNISYSTTPPAPPVLNEDATYPPSFPCYHPTCNVTCRSRQYRDTHFFTQHFGEKNNFQCDIDGCENTYDYRQSLQRHQEREHGKLRSRRIRPT